MPVFQPYRGVIRTLVLGFDVGTTYSGVSYAILDPGEIPSIHGVTRFPGQENAAGDSKIPSIIYYRPDGTVHSIGAETTRPGIELEVEDEHLILVEWFKFHLFPDRMRDSEHLKQRDLPALPSGKTVLDVFSDFLRYLLSCSRRFICETHANGDALWVSMEDTINFVLSHPNGWEGLQQEKMRQAAVMAGLVPNNVVGHKRMHFVTEGEASLSFCIQSGLTSETLRDGKSVMIVDAGGGTIDVSSYVYLSTSPVSVEEATVSDCILQGSNFVNRRAEKWLRVRLQYSQYNSEDDIRYMLKYFDSHAKPVFKDDKEVSYVKFGPMNCNDYAANIRRGQLVLTGSEMASFFKPSVDAIVNTVKKQRAGASHKGKVSTIFLVGGYAASPWLYTSLKSKLNKLGFTLYRPDSHTNKAVANGAVAYYIEHFVSVRIAKVTYGIEIVVDYDPMNPEHYARRHQKYTQPSGRVVLPNGFSTILKVGTSVRVNDEISQPYSQEARESRMLNHISSEVLCYRGRRPDSNPRWIDVDPELYTPLCTIQADTSQVYRRAKHGPNGIYYVQEFKIILFCGMTELRAQLSWIEKGVEKRGPARIVYDNDLDISRV